MNKKDAALKEQDRFDRLQKFIRQIVDHQQEKSKWIGVIGKSKNAAVPKGKYRCGRKREKHLNMNGERCHGYIKKLSGDKQNRAKRQIYRLKATFEKCKNAVCKKQNLKKICDTCNDE